MNIRLTVAGLLSALVLCACFNQNPPPAKQLQKAQPRAENYLLRKPSAPASAQPLNDTLCIAAVGDIMLGTSYPNNSGLPTDSGKNSFKNIINDLRRADVTMGNLEGNLLDSGAPAYFKLHQLSKSYLFKMPTSYAQVLKEAGFDVLSLANNHMADFGERGRRSTMRVLDSAGIRHGGQVTHPTAIFTIRGTTYGFCAFAPNSQTLPILDLRGAANIIRDLKSKCDIVIVSFHGGGEGPDFEHVTRQPEIYVGENRGNVHAFAHTAIDAGADMVLGNGPHVCRAMELYKNRLIAYSLGNFCTYKSVSVEGVCGLAPLLKIYTNKKGEFLNGRLIALKQTHANGLMRDSTNKVIARIKYLTTIDFPESGLNIADDGVITPLPQTVLAAGGQN